MKKFYPVFIFTLLGIFLFGKTLFPPSGYMLYGGDVQDQFYWWKSYLVESIKSGTIPFWNPYSFSGTPFLSHPSLAPFYPLNLIFYIFPIHISFSIYLFIHVVLSGIFMYWLVQRKWGELCGYFSGVVFALSGMTAVRIYAGHIDIISTITWMPLVFGTVVLALQTKRKKFWLLGIIFLTVQILAGYQFVVFLTIATLLIFTAGKMLRSILRKVRLAQILQTAVIFTSIIFFSYTISAVQYLSTLQFVRHSIRADGLPYILASWGSYSISTLRLFLDPFAYGDPFPDTYTYIGPGPNFFEITFYSGILPLAIILFFSFLKLKVLIASRKINVWFLFYSGLLLICTGFSFGKNFVFYPILYNLFPPFRFFRFPSQYLIAAVFLLAILSGISLNYFKNKYFKLAIIFLTIFDLLFFDKNFIKLSKIPLDKFDKSLVQTLQKNSGVSRLLPEYTVVSKVREDWDFESSAILKIHTTSGYNPLILRSYYHFLESASNLSYSALPYFNVEIPPLTLKGELLQYLNTKFVLSDRTIEHLSKSSVQYQRIIQGNRYNLDELQDYLPRYFFVNKVRIFPDIENSLSAIRSGQVDLRSELILLGSKDTLYPEKVKNCDAGLSGKIDITSYQLNKIDMLIDSLCDGFISSSDPYYPGWEVKVDGKKEKMLVGNTAFRAFYIPQGKHAVEVYYDPYIYKAGAIVSIVSLGVLFIVYKKFDQYVH